MVRASEASSAEQVNERTDEQVALYSWLIWATVGVMADRGEGYESERIAGNLI